MNLRRLILATMLLPACAWSQTPAPAPTAPPPVISPEVQGDGSVIFRLRAPRATEVTVSGDFWQQQNRVGKLTRGEDGVWSLHTEALPSDLYSYWFTLDGVRLPDPVNGMTKPGITETQSAFFVPGPAAALLQPAAVPHGEVRTVFYPAAGRTRRMHVYTPPGYDSASATRYPVLYLLHGGGDDDGTWEAVGRVNFILDNLLAQGKARPMIVVMPSLWITDPPLPPGGRASNELAFAKSLETDIVPFVDAHFRVLPGVANRALGGLGDGREFLPTLVWQTLGHFGSVLSVSGGVDQARFDVLQKTYPGVLDRPANVAAVRFFLGGGTNDASFASGTFLAKTLREHGYKVQFAQSDNTHGWPEFRYNFVQFSMAVFQQNPENLK